MKAPIKERNMFLYCLFTILTLGIYAFVFWSKFAKDVNTVCEGDGKKTMKYIPSWLLSFITFSIVGIVWKAKLAARLKDNAERYGLRFSESGALTAVYSVICFPVAHFIMIKNFNKIAKAYNDYNNLVDPDADKRANLFVDEED